MIRHAVANGRTVEFSSGMAWVDDRRRFAYRATAVVVAAFASTFLFGAPASADPPSGNETTIVMPMPGVSQSSGSSGSTYQPPPVGISVQDGTGGVDRDGTSGVIDPDGINGRVSGPLMRATPGVRATPAPLSPHLRS